MNKQEYLFTINFKLQYIYYFNNMNSSITANKFFQLIYLNKIWPDFWAYVHYNYIINSHTHKYTYEDVKKFNNEIDFLDLDQNALRQNPGLITKQFKDIYQYLKNLYNQCVQNYYRQNSYLHQNQQAYFGNYPQNQAYGFGYGNIYYQYPQNTNQQYQQVPQQLNFNQQQFGQQYYNNQPQYGQQQFSQQNSYNQPYYNQGSYNQPNHFNHHSQNHRGYGHNHRTYEDHQNRYIPKNNEGQNTQTSLNKVQSQATTVQQAKIPEPQKVEAKPQPPKIQKKKLSIEEIRKMISNLTDKEQLKKSVNPELVSKIDEVKNWEKKTQTFQIQPQTQKQYQQGQGGNYRNRQGINKKNTNAQYQQGRDNQEFKMGSRHNTNKNQLDKKGFDIEIGKKQTLQTRLIKKTLIEKAKEDFSLKKQQEQKGLSKIQSSIRNIQYCLNRVAPENLKQIYKQIEVYALKDEQVCKALVRLIIQKAWQQPKYAASYAKLSSYFCKIQPQKFQFGAEKKKKNNQFKHLLIEQVQHSFDKKQRNIQKDQSDPEKYAREIKNQIIGNIKFIAQLIKIKLISKKITKYCISKLLQFFLEGRYLYLADKVVQDNFFEFYFQAIILFLENLADKFETIDQKQKKDQKQDEVNIKEVIQKINGFCQLKSRPQQISNLDKLKANEYFEVLDIIRVKALKQTKDGGRLSALLQNLIQRRNNNWRQHFSQASKPVKLKDVNKQEEIISPQQRAKIQSKQVSQKMKKFFKKYIQGDNKSMEQFESIYKKSSFNDFMAAYLTQVSDDKKDNIPKRLELFDKILNQYLGNSSLLQIWKNNFQNFAYLGSQFPFYASTLAKILIKYQQKKNCSYLDYFIKYDEDEQEDEFSFMENVFQKLYYYTKNEEIKKCITPKEKQSHLL